ncbi:MAG: SpoVR family protein, partial [Pseudomonadaceae bacterium]|nr:SpoVR family protein [Pseudomonadaceae bacterium]
MSRQPISTGSEWTFDLIREYDREIGRIAHEVYGLDTYPNQIEVITAEQMMDAYASVGMPLGYHHWSYGKHFLHTEKHYKRGQMGLAYEIVINSDPCIAYLMEENTMTMQALVIAHACYGHNSFFKGNYLFRSWTDAGSIIDYLVFARQYITQCEERYGIDAVEDLLDSCHALMNYGVDRYKRPAPVSAEEERRRQREREEYLQRQVNDLWRTIPVNPESHERRQQEARFPAEPQENLLYFIEKNAPLLEPWQREVVRIVRKIAQYFYPQRQTQVMNEGWATFWHYTLLNHLYDEGKVTDGFMMEFLQSHTSVIYQPPFDSDWFSGINPYALGFAMMQDIRRMCENPTEEDRRWFPDIAGSDWLETLKFAMRTFKDESFILQYLSPRVIRELKLFAIVDDEQNDYLEVAAIHDDSGYRRVRELLAAQY